VVHLVQQVYNKAPPSWFDRRGGGDGSGSSGDVGGIGGGNSFDGAYLRPCSWRERRRERRRERGRATKAWRLEEQRSGSGNGCGSRGSDSGGGGGNSGEDNGGAVEEMDQNGSGVGGPSGRVYSADWETKTAAQKHKYNQRRRK